MEGLRGSFSSVQEPQKQEGYMMKRRKWPMKGWHKVTWSTCVVFVWHMWLIFQSSDTLSLDSLTSFHCPRFTRHFLGTCLCKSADTSHLCFKLIEWAYVVDNLTRRGVTCDQGQRLFTLCLKAFPGIMPRYLGGPLRCISWWPVGY